jgi:hypothetical protein
MAGADPGTAVRHAVPALLPPQRLGLRAGWLEPTLAPPFKRVAPALLPLQAEPAC